MVDRVGRRSPGVNAQEKTKEELMASLRQGLEEALEFNRKKRERRRGATTAKSR